MVLCATACIESSSTHSAQKLLPSIQEWALLDLSGWDSVMRCSPHRLVLTSAALHCKAYRSMGASGAERAIASLPCTIVPGMPDHNNAVCHRNNHQAVQFCSFCQ